MLIHQPVPVVWWCCDTLSLNLSAILWTSGLKGLKNRSCTRHSTGCRMCVHLEVKYQQCKLTCNACERLQAAIQGETGLQVRLVQQLSPCNDLHPSCKAWAQQDSCSKDPQAMLGLCQVSSTGLQQQPDSAAQLARCSWKAVRGLLPPAADFQQKQTDPSCTCCKTLSAVARLSLSQL